MKTAIKAFSLFVTFIIIFLTASCVTTRQPVPEKYNFDDKLEKVNQIVTFKKKTAWEKLDMQSFIFTVSSNDYYLIILERPISTYLFSVDIPSKSTSISTGFDGVVVYSEGSGPMDYKIERIYRLKDKEQREEIRAKLKI